MRTQDWHNHQELIAVYKLGKTRVKGSIVIKTESDEVIKFIRMETGVRPSIVDTCSSDNPLRGNFLFLLSSPIF